MPAVTRSYARKIVDELKTSPYTVSVRNHAKVKYPKVSGKLEEILNREDTPEPGEIINTLLELSDRSLRAQCQLDTEMSMMRGLHIVGDILYKCLVPTRKHILTKTKKNTSEFIDSWIHHGIDDDTTDEANVLMDFVRNSAKNKSKNPTYVQHQFQKLKVWLRIYAERCELVHDGFDDMEPQKLWNTLKSIEEEVNSGSLEFSDPSWKKYVLEAISDMRFFKFNLKDGKWKDKSGNLIEV